MSESHTDVALRQKIISGGAAGDHAVSGIKTEDVLKSVVGFTLSEGTPNTVDPHDLTDEFEIASDGTINNDGGTDTTGGALVVTYIAADPAGEDLNRT